MSTSATPTPETITVKRRAFNLSTLSKVSLEATVPYVEPKDATALLAALGNDSEKFFSCAVAGYRRSVVSDAKKTLVPTSDDVVLNVKPLWSFVSGFRNVDPYRKINSDGNHKKDQTAAILAFIRSQEQLFAAIKLQCMAATEDEDEEDSEEEA